MGQRQPRIVRNRDIGTLEKVHYLKGEIESLEERARWERERMKSITQHLSAAPGGGGGRGMDDCFAKIDSLEERHRNLISVYDRTIRKAEAIIGRISSAQMRCFVTMLYLDGKSGSDVQSKLKMTRWQFENARECVENAECMDAVLWHDRYAQR